MSEVIPVKVSIVRGGTSKGIFILENELPKDPVLRDKYILEIFGSPDVRQIDGLGGADVLATSYTLSQAIQSVGDFDLILCGKQTTDGDTAQVGPQIAEKLHLPQVSYAGEITKDGNTLTIKRVLEDGYMTIKVNTPCMITCIKELNAPRYLSVGGAFEAYSKPLVTMTYETLKDHPLIDKTTIGLAGSPTNILTSFTPPQKGAGMMLEGAGKETTDKLAGILAAKHII